MLYQIYDNSGGLVATIADNNSVRLEENGQTISVTITELIATYNRMKEVKEKIDSAYLVLQFLGRAWATPPVES